MAVGDMCIEERRTIERRAAASVKAIIQKRNRIKQAQQQRKTIQHLQTKRLEDTSSSHLWLVNYGKKHNTIPLALGYHTSLVLPVTFRHTTACRSPALVLSAAIHLIMKRSAIFSTVLSHSPSSWAAVVHWSVLMLKALDRPGNTLSTIFPAPPRSPRPPPLLRTSRTSAVSCPPCAPHISRTRFASCVKSPQCSHFPS